MMAEKGPGTGPDAALQKYSLELLACLDEMKYKRDQLHKQILVETKEKELVQADLKKLSEMLVKVNESICDKITAKTRLDEAVKDTEQAFTNLAKGSENLLKFMMQVTGEIMPLIKEPETGKGETETKKRTASSRKSMRSK